MTDFRVYIADLAAYNNAVLRGKHWDPTEFADADDFQTAVSEWLASDEDLNDELRELRAGGYYLPEEWAIHDYEAPAGIRVSEYDSLSTVFDLAAALDEHGDAYAAYVSNVGIEYATPEDFEEVYAGSWESEEAFAEEFFEDVYSEQLEGMNSTLRFAIDWSVVWRELHLGSDYYSVYVSDPEFTYHIFRSN